MKNNILYLGIMVLMVLIISSCATPVQAAGQEEQELPAVPPVSEPASIDIEIEMMTALVELNSIGEVTLVEDWDSKSRKTYTVIGDMKQELRNYLGEVIESDVIFLEREDWSGALVVVSIKTPKPE